MQGFSLCRHEALMGLLLILLLSGSFCYGSGVSTVEVVGFGECADCKDNNIETSHALSGLKVTVDCKLEDGKFQRRGVGKMNEEGEFKVSLPQEILKDGKLAEECYAQLHNAADAPCAVHSGLEASKITFLSKSNEKHTFGPTGKLKFSSAVCTSAFFWPLFKHPPLPKPYLPKGHPWLKKFGHVLPPLPPKITFPPKIPFKKPCPPPVPEYKPTPKPPVYKPKPKPEPPVYKPKPEPPVYKPKPKPPVYKPKPEPPVYKPKPEPPVYKPKPKPPVYKPKPKPPVYKPKPEPPVYKPKPKPPVYEPKPKPPVYEPKPKPPAPTYKPLPPYIPIYKPHPKILPPPIPIFKPHPKILPPPIPIFKPHPKILPPPIPIFKPLPPFYKKPCPPFSLPQLPPKVFKHPIIPLPPHP